MDEFVQRVLGALNHRVLANMTPDRVSGKLAIVNNIAGNKRNDEEREKSTFLNNLRALRFKRGGVKPTDGERRQCEENVNKRHGHSMTPTNDSTKVLNLAGTEEVLTCTENVKRCSSVPVEVHSSLMEESGFCDFSQNLLTVPNLSVTNLLEEIEADLPPSYSLANVLDHTLHTVTNLRTWARLSRVGTSCIQVAENEKLKQDSESDHINKITRLEKEIYVQKTLIEQADKAVSLCKVRKRNLDVEDLESVRVLLMAKLRYDAINVELQKLSFSGGGEPQEVNLGELEIPDVWFTVSNSENWDNYHYVCIAYHREKLFASHVESEIVDGKLHFLADFKFDGLGQNFIICLELYQLNVSSKMRNELKKMLNVKSLIKLANRRSSATKDEHRDYERVGSATLTLADVRSRAKGKISVHFHAVSQENYSAFGKIASLNVRTRLVLNSKISGFLDLFKDRCWHRLWCCPAGYALQFWCYPEDKDNDKAPVESVLLSLCSGNIQPVSMDVCIRPHSFMIMYNESDKGILLSATSHKEMMNWINYLRSVIRSLEAWAPTF